MSDDRRVHAVLEQYSLELVRYDRRGHWYEEKVFADKILARKRLTLAEAVERATEFQALGGDVFLNLPGGGRFDHAMRAE